MRGEPRAEVHGSELEPALEQRHGEAPEPGSGPRERQLHAPMLAGSAVGAVPEQASSATPSTDTDARRHADAAVTNLTGFTRDAFAAAIVETSEDAICAFTPDGVVLTWNKGAEVIFGYPARDVVGKHVSMLVAPEELQRLGCFVEQVLGGRVVSQFDGTGLRRDQTRVNLSITGSPVKNAAGDLVAIAIILRDSSPRVRAEESRALLASIVESTDDAIASAGLDGKVLSWNKAAEALFGYSAAEIVGHHFSVVVPPDRIGEAQRAIARVRQGEVQRYESVRVGKSGESVDVALTISPIRNVSGTIVGNAMIAHDLRERVRSERCLRDSEERFRSAFEHAPFGMALLGLGGEVLRVNEAFARLFDAPAHELLGVNWSELTHADDRQDFYQITDRLVQNQSALVEIEARQCSRRNGAFWARSGFSLVRGVGGEAEDVIVHVQDIAERRRAADALRESEERFRTMADGCPTPLWVTDAMGGVRFINRAYRSSFGTTYDAVKDMQWRPLLHPDDADTFLASFARACAAQAPFMDEVRVRVADGSWRWFATHAAPRFSSAGEFLGHVGLSWDLTERKRVEEDLVTARAAADAANVAKSRFLANVSHEIRTPMNGVLGMAQLLASTKLSDEQLKYTRVIESSGRALQSLIEGILDLATIEAHKVTLLNQELDLQSTLDEVLDAQREVARLKGLSLRARVSRDAPRHVVGDARRLQQVLTNLIANAIKFSEVGSVELTTEVASRSEQRATLRFTVRDTGIGIAPEQAARLFSPFVQADSSTTRKYGGAGLGLAISKQLVELMGGAIGFESRVGEGSTFWFTADLECRNDVDEVESQPAPPSRSLEPRPSTMIVSSALTRLADIGRDARILLAEDNPTNQIVIKAQLAKLGFPADVVANGAEAVKALVRGSYDLVLMDCEMPVMDGYEATRVIRASRKTRIPIIAVTAHAAAGERSPGRDLGMDDFLTKPVDIERLAEALAKWLARESDDGAPRTAHAAPSLELVQAKPAPVVARAVSLPALELRSAELPLFDPEALLERLMRDRVLARRVVQGFIADAPGQIADLSARLAAGDVAGARLRAHALKGSSATIAARRLSALASELEKRARGADMKGFAALLPRAAAELEELADKLRREGWLDDNGEQ